MLEIKYTRTGLSLSLLDSNLTCHDFLFSEAQPPLVSTCRCHPSPCTAATLLRVPPPPAHGSDAPSGRAPPRSVQTTQLPPLAAAPPAAPLRPPAHQLKNTFYPRQEPLFSSINNVSDLIFHNRTIGFERFTCPSSWIASTRAFSSPVFR
jgi:hypothetical protein